MYLGKWDCIQNERTDWSSNAIHKTIISFNYPEIQCIPFFHKEKNHPPLNNRKNHFKILKLLY